MSEQPLNKEQILEEREIWYSHDMVLFEIVKCLNNKELCLLSDKSCREEKKRVRYYKANNKEYLLKAFKYFRFLEFRMNIYHSVSYFSDIPMFTLNLRERSKQTQEWKDKHDYINGYDFFIDIDGKNEDFYKDAEKLKRLFDTYKLPYYLLNSSSKGFHFIIEHKYLPDKKPEELVKDIKKITDNIKAVLKLNCLDNSIYDIDRVKKCPYSYVCDGTIALPLSDSQFKMFNNDMVLMKNVLKDVKLFKRGLLTRSFNLSEEQLKKRVLLFWGDFLE